MLWIGRLWRWGPCVCQGFHPLDHCIGQGSWPMDRCNSWGKGITLPEIGPGWAYIRLRCFSLPPASLLFGHQFQWMGQGGEEPFPVGCVLLSPCWLNFGLQAYELGIGIPRQERLGCTSLRHCEAGLKVRTQFTIYGSWTLPTLVSKGAPPLSFRGGRSAVFPRGGS